MVAGYSFLLEIGQILRYGSVMDDVLRPPQDSRTLYDRDFAAWCHEQAGLLRGAAGADDALDWLNLAEEIEGLANRDRREVAAHIRTIAEHLMKLQASPAAQPRAGWVQSIMNARQELELIFQDSPSLRRQVPAILEKQLDRAREKVERALADHGEAPVASPHALTYTPDELLTDWWPAGAGLRRNG